jgi:hypothetical protein
MFTIEDDVPLPPRYGHSLYPWDRLEVGQSFEVKGVTLASMASGAAKAGRSRGRKFVARATDSGGVRVWRVA